MNVYDFDGTIYDGDCTVDFYRYCLGRHPKIARRWGALAGAAVLYALRRIDKTGFKQRFFAFLRDVDNIEGALADFWRGHAAKVKPWYRAQHRADDVVISASPEFLLMPICRSLKVRMIGSRVDPRTGLYTGKNCGGGEKILRFRALYPDAVIENFYSDSHADDPMAGIARESFWVDGMAIRPWPDGKTK